jgi:NADH:ubiquinone oxidoreductase subunit F (NADH-binding)/NADH:ubiquinone oxidoreductase subunit E
MASAGLFPIYSESPEHPTEGVFQELKEIQRKFGYLPAEQLQELADRRGVHLNYVHSVASFYPHFHLKPTARVDVRVCGDMSCHLRQAAQFRTALERNYRQEGPEDISFRDASCLGRCDAAPAISINDHIYAGLDLTRTIQIIDSALAGKHLPEPPLERKRVMLRSNPYGDGEPYGFLRQYVKTRDWQSVIATLKDARLRGMGGAGFPTGMKWELVRNAPGSPKYIICNADESEPGTIKDRFIIEQLPKLVLEGMIIAGLVTGAERGYLYIRHEYEPQAEIIRAEIERCYLDELLGSNLLGSGLAFDLEVFISPGGYICGEESALIEAIEGHRAEPRNKPPFPGTHGLWMKPTVINNVETFALATLILNKGAEWIKAQGRGGASGLKFVGVSGHVRKPGVFEVPMGITYHELIYDHAGGILDGAALKAFAPSGPSSGYLPARMADLPLDWDALAKVGSMVGSGAIVVCNEQACMLDMALNAVTFYRNESCGKCVPCRVGSQKLVEMLSRWTAGQGNGSDQTLMDELFHALRMTSICGLGQIIPAPIASVLKHFPDEVEAHWRMKQCPAGVCFSGVHRRV